MSTSIAKLGSALGADDHKDLTKKQHTSFGKLILAKEKSSPVFSKLVTIIYIQGFSNEQRFKSQVDKQIASFPLAKYEITDPTLYRFKKPSCWAIGTSNRRPLNDNEQFDFYKHKDSHPFVDRSMNLLKQPRFDKIKGGAIPIENKADLNSQMKRCLTPGPNRYNPKIETIKSRPPSHYMSEKGKDSAIKLFVGTNDRVGPGAYRVESAKPTSKHTIPPTWTIPKSTNKSTNYKPKNETYFYYSSMGQQVMSSKNTEVKYSIGNEKKNKVVRGTFTSHMSFRPTKVYIPHPVI